MTEAHFIIDTTVIRPKDLGTLDQLHGGLVAANSVASFQKATKLHTIERIAAKLAKTGQVGELVPIVVIGHAGSVNACLAGLFSINPDLRWPILLIDCPAKGIKVNQMVSGILASLATKNIHQVRLGKISGFVPKQGNQYFLDTFQIGPDFSAILPKFDQKFALKNAFHQAINFWGFSSRNQNNVTFAWTLRFGSTYQSHSKTLGFQIILGQGDQPNEVHIVNQVSWPQILRTYRQGKKGTVNPSRKGFTSFAISEPADFHIRDIQTAVADSQALNTGAYAFRLTTAGTYPVVIPADPQQEN
ncbi:hypothetical protein [Fructobacillus ficulneus]|uniref:DAGKc domain-containing protein n=1 Tax=Fructobacillus ficulneus TaxID=157463 RepID=A0A0K8MGJ4_9LACO|nr:hypothetical protein [Fructobacillus ficulneus]GAO99676.1 hypothetical protein FFIC_231630 [Fructobacillus ficulneus]